MPSRTRDLRPLYAAAGLTELIAAALRDRLAHAQGEAVHRWTDLKHKAPQMPVELSRATRERLSSLQTRAGQIATEAGTTYNQLAEHGKAPVDEAFGFARTFGHEAGDRLVDTIAAPLGRATEALRPVAQKWLGEVGSAARADEAGGAVEASADATAAVAEAVESTTEEATVTAVQVEAVTIAEPDPATTEEPTEPRSES